jgi:hypothetical protein
MPWYSNALELIFEIRDAEKGGFHARASGHAIFTDGDTWEELRTTFWRQFRSILRMLHRVHDSCRCIMSETS